MRSKHSLAGMAVTLLLVLLVGLSMPLPTYGQLGKGTVTGTVTDPTGAVVPNATVTLTNTATGLVRTDETNAAGLYRFDLADVGAYMLRVTAKGFANYEVHGLVLTVAQTLTVPVALELAKAAAQTITVQAGGVQLVQTSSSEVSGLVDRNTLAALPLEIRDPSAFVNLMPGAIPSGLGDYEFNGSTRGSSVNGARGGTGNFMVDGFDNNDQGQGGRSHNTVGTMPGAMTGISPDAIQEFRVVTNSFTAQYGRQAGFVADAVIKSGTNQIHGTLFEYNRNSAITANDFFSNRVGAKDSLVRNQFGGSLGGPLRKNKTFLFGAIEIQRLRKDAPNVVTSVTPDFVDFVRTGGYADFMESNAGGICMQLFEEACPGAFDNSRTLGPVASSLLQKYPYPAPTSDFSYNSEGYYSAIFGVPIVYPVPIFGQADIRNYTKLNGNRLTLKLDHNVGSNDRFTGMLAFDDFDTFDSSLGTDGAGSPYFPMAVPSRAQNWGIGHTHTFSSNVVNEFKASYLRHSADFGRNIDPTVPSIVTAFDPNGVGIGMSSGLPQGGTDAQFQYQDQLAISKGRHSLNLGLEYRRTRNASTFAESRDGFWVPYDTENLLTDGWAAADFENAAFGEPYFGSYYYTVVSINPVTGELPEYYRGFRGNEFGAYFQDNWKVHSRLTLNLGLRWDYIGVPHNFRPGLDSNFFFGPADVPIATASDNPNFPLNSVPYARIATAAFQQVDSGLWNKDTNNFGPRFGFAWDVFGDQKTVVRGGFGVYYDRIWNNLFENIRFNPPYYSDNYVGAFVNGFPAGPASTPDLFTIPVVTAAYNNPDYQPAPNPRHMHEGLVTPYSEQVHFGIQRQIAESMLFEVNYIGTFGHKLTGVQDINTFNGRILYDEDFNYAYSTARPNTTIGADNARANYYNSNYHALQARFEKRMSHGLQFQTNYTWAHYLDYVSDAFQNRATAGNNNLGTMDVMNHRLDYGRSDADLRHRFVLSLLYDLPFFRTNRWAGGWRIGTIVTLQTGLPFTIYNGNADNNGDGKYVDRPNYLGNGDPNEVAFNRSMSPADSGYMRTDLFEDPAFVPGGWVNGTLGRNTLTSPGYANTDFTFQKIFKFTERVNLQLQMNFFNLFNRTNYGFPDGNMASPSFGQSTNSFGPRIGQIAARLEF